jgi:hypothetical protein
MITPMVTARFARLGAFAVSLALMAAGCGSGGLLASTTTRAGRGSGVPADPASVSVIRGWSDALRRGDVRGAAHYFALPSDFVNGTGTDGQPELILIRTPAEAEAANEALPCGAKLISTSRHGRYVNALFKLTARSGPGGGGCDAGAGQTARTDFLIAHGLIVEWIRAPDQPGDNGSPGSGGSPRPPGTPSTPTTTGPVV